jgi:DnaJ-domain-containing protein 1
VSTLLLLCFVAILYWGYHQAGKPKKRRQEGKPPPTQARSRASACDLLGVSEDATPEQIRKAYQDRVRQYHPDRVAQAAPELQRLAELRTKELNAAYEALTRS